MSPVAIQLNQDPPTSLQSQKQPVVGPPGPTLVIGTLSTAKDRSYLNLIDELNELKKDSANASEVERQMIDRILDGGELIGNEEGTGC